MSQLLRILLPEYCICCGNELKSGEKHLCMSCLSALPLVPWADSSDNVMLRALWPSCNVISAAAAIEYSNNSPYHNIIVSIKYRMLPAVGRWMAATNINKWVQRGFLQDVDVIIPVPLTPAHQRRRGYNQSHWIALGIADVTFLPIDATILFRHNQSVTQTHASAEERQFNTSKSFYVDPVRVRTIKNKHILLVDDVFTTGATIRACVSALLQAVPDCRISVYTLSMAK